MNILILTYEITSEGGNFIRCFSLAKNLVKLGHNISILSSNTEKRLRLKYKIRNGVKIIEAPCILPFRIRHNGTSPFQVIGRCIYILKNKYDIVHGFGHRPSVIIPSLLHRFLYKAPYIADWCDLWGRGGIATLRGGGFGTLTEFFDTLSEKMIYKRVNGLTVVNTDLKKRALANGLSPKKIKLISIGADIDNIKPLPKQKMRKKHGLPHSAHIVVFVGNAPYDEGLLANTFLELSKINSKALLLFVGREMSTFKEIISKTKLENRVIEKGFVPHNKISELLSCGDVMLLPYTDRSINRGRFPNKLGDYIAAGRPTVANPTGDLKKFFEKERVGLLTPENPKAFAQTVNKLLLDKKLRETLGRNARKTAENEMSWKMQARKLVTFYRKVLND